MTYSYIKSVFPNFETVSSSRSLALGNIPRFGREQNNLTKTDNSKGIQGFDANKYSKQIVSEYKEFFSNDNGVNKSSLKTQQQEEGEQQECSMYASHVLRCESCKDIIRRQLGYEEKRFQNDQLLEIVTYGIFGAFLLVFLENFKKA
uniref:Uncharacterized protein n=1 Tax=viral metagenome TaxID=1070528 RepID=A0A6C0DZA9_9ZZZZ